MEHIFFAKNSAGVMIKSICGSEAVLNVLNFLIGLFSNNYKILT
jgi:hypothetical protein